MLNCPAGTLESSNTCVPCDSDCKACSGTVSSCISCNDPLLLDTNSCVDACSGT